MQEEGRQAQATVALRDTLDGFRRTSTQYYLQRGHSGEKPPLWRPPRIPVTMHVPSSPTHTSACAAAPPVAFTDAWSDDSGDECTLHFDDAATLLQYYSCDSRAHLPPVGREHGRVTSWVEELPSSPAAAGSCGLHDGSSSGVLSETQSDEASSWSPTASVVLLEGSIPDEGRVAEDGGKGSECGEYGALEGDGCVPLCEVLVDCGAVNEQGVAEDGRESHEPGSEVSSRGWNPFRWALRALKRLVQFASSLFKRV
jgi:hypothetical protein